MMKTLRVILLLLGFALSPAKGADVRMFNTLADLASWVPSTLSSNFTVRSFDSSRPFATARPGHYDATSVASTNAGCVYATSTGVGRNIMDDCGGGEVDVRWFGADASGILPSSAAIQAATDYTYQMEGRTNKGVVLFPPGTFLIDATIVDYDSPLPSFTIWRGKTKALTGQLPNEFSTTLKAAPNLNAPILAFTHLRHAAVTGIAFDGNRENQSGFAGNGLVELAGAFGALESDLTDVATFQSKTNGIFIARHVVQFERVISLYNDGDGIRFNYGWDNPSNVIADCSFQNVQLGFNKGNGIWFQVSWVMRIYNMDVYFNNQDGMRISGGGVYRVYGLQSNNNGQNSLKIEGNNRDMEFVNCLFADGNWNQFENYPDPLVPEMTNSAPSGTYHNVNIVGDGNQWELSFIGSRFWSTPGGHPKKVGYLLYDGHGSSFAGRYITMIDPRLVDSTNHWDLGVANGDWLKNSTMVGVRYGGTNAFTKFAEPLRRTVFSDTDSRNVIQIERDDPVSFLTMLRPNNPTPAWVTMDLGKGIFRQFANEGLFLFGNTNSGTAPGMARANYLMLPQFWSTNQEIVMLSGISRTNPASGPGENDLRIGGGSELYDAFNRILFYTATNYSGSTGGVLRLAIRPDGQVDFVPLSAAPTNQVVDGQVYFNPDSGLNQRIDGAWRNTATATGTNAALWTQVRTARTNAWAIFSQVQPLTFYWLPAVGGGYATHYFDTNGSINSVQGTFWNSGNDGTGSGLDADTVRGTAYPTNNGAYVLLVTNGVASWIAHP